MPEPSPAPALTITSAPSPLSFLAVSGVTATRGSEASSSPGIAIFMRPPVVPTTRPGWRRVGSATRRTSGQERRHQDEDEDNEANGPLHQLEEQAIGAFMLVLVVTGCGRVF